MTNLRKKTQLFIFIAFFLVPLFDIFRLDLINRSFFIFRKAFSFQQGIIYLLAVLFLVISFLAISRWSNRKFCSWICPHNTLINSFFKLFSIPIIKNNPIIKHSLSISLSTFASLAASYGILAYFISPVYLIVTIMRLQFFTVIGVSFLFLFVIFFILIFFLKQRFCRYACPYGQLQNIFMQHGPVNKNSFSNGINLLFVFILSVLFTSLIALSFYGTQYDIKIREKTSGVIIEDAKIFSFEIEISNNASSNSLFQICVGNPENWEIQSVDTILVESGTKEKVPLVFMIPKEDFNHYFIIDLDIIDTNTTKKVEKVIAIQS